MFDTLATFKQYNQNGFNDNLSTVESINANYILCKLENNVKYRDVNVYNEYFLIKTNNNKLKEKPKLLIAETNKDFSEYSILPEAIFTSDTVDSYVVEGQVTAGTVARIQTDKDKINEIIKSI